MADIIVAGAGHGGLVAAFKLAEGGHNVTVYEKNARDAYPLDEEDYFDAEALRFAGIDIPERYPVKNNSISFVPLDDDSPVLTMPANEKSETLVVNRRDLFEYLLSIAEEKGVRLVFNSEITGPVILGSRVCGIKTRENTYYGDLIIDACGVYSPLRSNLPAFLKIDNEPGAFNVLHTYRAYFDNNGSEKQPETDYNIYLKKDGTAGLSWAVTDEKSVDVLIARFYNPEYSEVADELHKISLINPQMGKNMIRGGKFADIPVRHPLAVMVADGYAAVGDSAFMTAAVKGSGIAYSIMAGTMLAGTVLEDTECRFTAETLWKYEKEFFKVIGFNACRISLFKNLLPFLKAQELSDLFKKGLITTEELSGFKGNTMEMIIKSRLIPLVKSKIKVLDDMPEFKNKLKNLVAWQGRFTLIEPFFPNKYSVDDAEKWAQRYNEFFDSIKYEENITD